MLREIYLSLFYSGRSKFAPGTMGSIVALIIAIALLEFISLANLFIFAVLIAFVSIKLIDDYQKEHKVHDPSFIVIDELIGLWLAIGISGETYIQIFLSFIFFRFFDISKPSIIGRIDKKVKGGLGVVLDDVVAGLFGGLLSSLVYKIYTYFLGIF